MASATLPCQPAFREDTDVATAGIQGAVPTGAGTALYQPPKDVIVRVTDNDVIAVQAVASVDGCRATTLFQFAQSTADSVGVFKKQWLTDYNCKSGDAGGLPGYPVEVAADGFDGYCTLSTQTAKANCEAAQYCSVAGVCQYANAVFNARVEAECGVCTGIVAGEGTGAARFTESECIKDVDGDGVADGTWSTT